MAKRHPQKDPNRNKKSAVPTAGPPKMLVELEHYEPGFAILRFASCEYLSEEGEIGLKALCDDGTWMPITENLPTYAEYHNIDIGEGASPDKVKEEVCDQITGDPDDMPWFEYNAAGGVVPESDTLEAAKNWLTQPIDMSEDQYVDFGNLAVSDYEPGFALRNRASAEEHEVLSMRETDLGGPASSVPCIIVKDDPVAISEAFEHHGLDYKIRS